jgi:hypothetical protein
MIPIAARRFRRAMRGTSRLSLQLLNMKTSMSPGDACRKAGAHILFSAVPIVRGIVSTTTFPSPQHVSVDGAGESTVTRIQSIDIFRGITLAVTAPNIKDVRRRRVDEP